MKIVVILNSDTLALPSVHRLRQLGMFAGAAILQRSSHVLMPQLGAMGIDREAIVLLNKTSWQLEMEDWIQTIEADAVWVFGFPWLIPDQLLHTVSKGFLNFHFGKLPEYLGADPIFWQLKNNERYACLSVHQMTSQIDAGPLILEKMLELIKGENYGLLCQRLGYMAAELTEEILQKSNLTAPENKSAVPAEAKPPTVGNGDHKRPGPEQLNINWDQHSAVEIECLVNACNPNYGGAVTSIRNVEVRLLEVSPAQIQLQEEMQPAPGTIVYADAIYGLIVACQEQQFLKINTVHMREGYFSGTRLFGMGIQTGEKFLKLN